MKFAELVSYMEVKDGCNVELFFTILGRLKEYES